MENQWKSALGNVRKAIDALLAADSYPDRIDPELLREAVRLYPLRGGKRIRPALLLWACEAVGGNPDRANYAAAAVEIYHNWTLVHDDIIDCDEFRRGKPTSHVELAGKSADRFSLSPDRAKKYGMNLAILAGDLQQAWAMHMLLKTGDCGVSGEVVLAMARRMQSFLGRELISGEALDVEFEFRDELPSLQEAETMIRGKTGALLAYAAECGGMIGLNTPDPAHPLIQALSGFARNLGDAFQLCDDLLGVYGDVRQFGKPLCSDFREGKPTILLLEARNRFTASETEKMETLMLRTEYSESDIQEIRRLLVSCGAKKAVEEKAAEASAEAMRNLRLLPESEARTRLEAMTSGLLARTV